MLYFFCIYNIYMKSPYTSGRWFESVTYLRVGHLGTAKRVYLPLKVPHSKIGLSWVKDKAYNNIIP
jgi:hypothetical protein